ncbi:MAG: peptidase S41, partial [Pseudomonadota bacterium]
MQKMLVKPALVVVGIAIGLAGSIGGTAFAEKNEKAALPLSELRAFAEIFEKIKSDYVEDIDDKELLNNAIKGMLAGLDPHSAYLIADDYRDLR